MNSVGGKLGGFAVVLVVVFGGALALGAAAGPAVGALALAGQDARGGHDMAADGMAAVAEHGEVDGGPGGGVVGVPGGLAVSRDGYRFAPAGITFDAGRERDFRFAIAGPDGLVVGDYVEEHDSELHLIVVRRDLSGFQHVHPERDADGVWSVPLTLAEAGEYRALADFVPAGGEGLTLGVDLRAAGDYEPRPLPVPERTAEVDGYTVELAGDLVAGTSSDVILTVSRDGAPVTDLEPYLGAYGHLVALREGDLAYLHVDPHGKPGDGVTPAGASVAFAAEVPSDGAYRLYLDFSHGGVVRTAEFTVRTAGGHSYEEQR